MKGEVVTISRKLWKAAKRNPVFAELLEDLEDAEDLTRAKSSAKEFLNFDDYVKQRRRKRGVPSSCRS